MQYTVTHPRKVRGEAVHMTASEKKASEIAATGNAGKKSPASR